MSKERYPISEDQFQAITKFMDFIIQKNMEEILIEGLIHIPNDIDKKLLENIFGKEELEKYSC